MMIHDIKRLSSAGCPQLQTIGWMPAHKVDLKLVSYNINFSVQVDLDPVTNRIFTSNGSVRKATFPQLQMWQPGKRYEYKYDGRIESLYFGYEPSHLPRLKNLLNNAGTQIEAEFLKINLTAPIFDLMQNIRKLMRDLHQPGNIDRIDLLANMLLLECLLNQRQEGDSSTNEGLTSHKVRAIAAEIDRNYLNFNLDDTLKKHGVGRRTFFRHWNKIYAVSPHQYLLKRKLYQAQLLLEKNLLSIKDIANRTGFVDSFHFSKCFKQHYGLAPSKFRMKN